MGRKKKETFICEKCGEELSISDRIKEEVDLCKNCAKICSNCGKVLIFSDDIYHCETCDKIFCGDCITQCAGCGNYFCTSCISVCDICGEDTCSNCLSICSDCGNSFCENCGGSCESCGTSICESCHRYCDECDCGPYCSECVDNCCSSQCSSLEDFDNNPRILEYDTKLDNWEFFKMPWENTLYMGIELEMEFDNDYNDTFFNIAKEFLPKKHIWKYDGSIDGGGELVITPHTLLAYKKVDFRNLLKKLSDNGARSHDTEGRCGLHVHVNHEEISSMDFLKLKGFFVENKEFLTKFTRRKESELERYAAIPSEIENWNEHGRYISINETDYSFEFRIFRGTLNYDSFKSSLEFVDAIISFVKQASIATCHGHKSLSEFKKFIQNRYQILSKYILKKGL